MNQSSSRTCKYHEANKDSTEAGSSSDELSLLLLLLAKVDEQHKTIREIDRQIDEQWAA